LNKERRFGEKERKEGTEIDRLTGRDIKMGLRKGCQIEGLDNGLSSQNRLGAFQSDLTDKKSFQNIIQKAFPLWY